MKIATWNVNSLTTCLSQVLGWLAVHPAEILCLQELKLTNGKFTQQALEAACCGHCAVFGQKPTTAWPFLAACLCKPLNVT